MRPFLVSTLALFASTSFAFADIPPSDVCLFEEEDWSAVLTACNEALAASDDPIEQGRFILHRGFAHESLGDLEAARLDQILVGEYRPDWFRGYANAASLSELMDDPESQARWAQAAIDAEPDNARAYLEMLALQNNGDDVSTCLPTAERIIDLLEPPVDWAFTATPDPYLMGNLGFCLSRMDQPELAMQALLAADYMELEEAWLYSEISYVAYIQLDQPERALAYSTRAMEVGERNIYDVDTIIYSNVNLGDVDAALDAAMEYADLLDAQEYEWGTRNVVGWTLFLDDRLEEASTVMEAWALWAEAEIAAGRQTAGYVWDTVAHIRAALDDTDGARDAFLQAVSDEAYFEEERDLYVYELTAAGFDVGDDDASLIAALEACAATGPACRLIPDEDEAPQE